MAHDVDGFWLLAWTTGIKGNQYKNQNKVLFHFRGDWVDRPLKDLIELRFTDSKVSKNNLI
jgi:hypothetical protein